DGPERPDLGAAEVGNDDGSVRPYHGLAAQAACAGAVAYGRSPGQPAVRRAAEADGVAGAGDVELRVAVAEERAARCVVADDPVLVQRARRHRHRGAPGETVGRAAREHGVVASG